MNDLLGKAGVFFFLFCQKWNSKYDEEWLPIQKVNVFTFLQMLFVNNFYVSLIAFPLSPIKQLGKYLLLRSLLFFMVY